MTSFLTSPRRAWALALALALLQGGLLVHESWDKSENGNEPLYLNGAAMLWDQGRVERGWRALVPFWAFGLTLSLVDPDFHQGVLMYDDLDHSEDRAGVAEQMERIFWRKPPAEARMTLLFARLATILVTVGAGLTLWRVASRFGPLAGLVAHLLWCFSPTVLASGYLAMLDIWTATSLTFLLWAVVRLIERPRLRWAAVVGLFAALAIPTKSTTLAGVGLSFAAVAWVAWAGAGAPAGRREKLKQVLRYGGAAAGSAALVLWALMLFRVGRWHGIPYPDYGYYLEGILSQYSRGALGGENYLFGQVRWHGVWWFYLACLALKLTIGGQALGVLLAAALVRQLRRRPGLRALAVDAALLAPVVVLFLGVSAGNHQVNVNYLLPAFPYAFVWAGRTFDRLAELYGPRVRWAAAALLLIGAGESLRLHPHHQMFFNAWIGGPENGPRYLVVRDDNAQDRRAIGEWQAKHGVKEVYTIGMDVPGARDSAWGISAAQLPCEPRPGVYALNAHTVHIPGTTYAGCADWLTVEPPDERINYSIYVWRVDEARIARLTAKRGQVIPFWSSAHNRSEAPQLLIFRAVPEDGQVRITYSFTPQIQGVVVRSLDDFDAPTLFDAPGSNVHTSLGHQASVLVPANQRGFYAAVGLPAFIVGIAHTSGKGFLGTPHIKGSAKAALFWSVPQGPVQITDDQGTVLYNSELPAGMTTDLPDRTTTYYLSYPEGERLATTVTVDP